jgi:hypothetical protein
MRVERVALVAKGLSMAKKKPQDLNQTDKVNEYMAALDRPLKAEMEAVRAIIMNANANIGEHIKWNAPSFFVRGGLDKGGMATFNPRAKDHVHLVFHNAAVLNDDSGILEGDYVDRRMIYFRDMKDVKAKKAALERIVNLWVEFINKRSQR